MTDYVILYATPPIWEINRKIHVFCKDDHKFTKYRSFEFSRDIKVREHNIRSVLKDFLDYVKTEMIEKSVYLSLEQVEAGLDIVWIPLDSIIEDSGEMPTTYKRAFELYKQMLEKINRPRFIIERFEKAISEVGNEKLPVIQYEKFNENDLSNLIVWFQETFEYEQML